MKIHIHIKIYHFRTQVHSHHQRPRYICIYSNELFSHCKADIQIKTLHLSFPLAPGQLPSCAVHNSLSTMFSILSMLQHTYLHITLSPVLFCCMETLHLFI